MRHYKFTLSEIDMCIPWERDIYIILLEQEIEQEKQQNASSGAF